MPPHNISTPTPMTTNTSVGIKWEYAFDKSWMVDDEGDTLSYSFSISPWTSLISDVDNGTHYVLSANPNQNSQAQIHTLTIKVDDGHSDVDNYEFISSFEFLQNQPPTIKYMYDVAVLPPDGYTWSYGATLTEDPESLNYTTTLLFEGSSTIPNWLTFDPQTYTFSIASISNSHVGVYNVTIGLKDDYHPEVYGSFFLVIIQNSAPQQIKLISSFEVVASINFSHQFDPVDELFSDPDNLAMTSNILEANGDPLPPFLFYNQSDNTLSGTPGVTDFGDWNLIYVATDNANLTSNTSFVMTVKT